MEKNRTFHGLDRLWIKLLFVMRLTIFLFFAFVIGVQAKSYSQTANLTLNMSKTKLVDVLNEIEKQSDYYFYYNLNLDDYMVGSIVVKNKDVKNVLDVMLSELGLTYEVVDRYVVIKQTEGGNMTVETLVQSAQQQKSVSGKVTDSSGASLPGVSVVVKGTTNGTITDANGNYSLSNVPENADIQFSFVGMKAQEIAVGGKTSINVILEEETVGIEEVVAMGYGTQEKVNVTGSVATVDGEQLTQIPVASVQSTLVGRLSGLIAVNRSGEPGADGSEISIRGYGDALIIVDGIQQDFSQIDPNSIESISILKDASASIYGARAGNGVILVTSKRGKIGTPKINFSSSYGVQTPTRYPELASAPLFAQLSNEAGLSDFTDEEIEKFRAGNDPRFPNTNWYNETFRKWAPISQYNLNSRGGSERIKYFASLGYLNQESILRTEDIQFQRYNIRSNIDAKITERLSMELDINGSIELRESPGNANYAGGPIGQIMEDVYAASPISPSHFPDPTKLSFPGKGQNPLASSNSDIIGYSNGTKKTFNGGITLNYEMPFIEGLTVSGRFNYLTTNDFGKRWGKSYAFHTYDYGTEAYTEVQAASALPTLQEEYDVFNSYTTQLSINFERAFGKHEINALVLTELIANDGNYLSGYREGFISPDIQQLNSGGSANANSWGSAHEDGRVGYVGRLNYNYLQKYLAEFTFRYDMSAQFAETRRGGFFPGVSLGWRLSEEAFLKNSNYLSNLKLRASYGLAGNDRPTIPGAREFRTFPYLSGYNLAGNYAIGSSGNLSNGIAISGLPNPYATWEKTSTVNAGFEIGFFNNALTAEFDVFYREVTDVLGYRSQSIPSTFGALLPLENINSYDNRGFELRMGYRHSAGDFKYHIEPNITLSRSKWIDFDEEVYADEETRARLQQTGQYRNRWFGYEALGLFQSQEEIDNWSVDQDQAENSTIKPGDIKYADFNGDKILNYKDEHVIGRGTIPEMIFGLSLDASFKGFDINMLWQGASHFNTYFSDEAQNPFFNGTIPFAFFEDSWRENNMDAKYPRVVSSGAANNKHVSTYWLQDATYLRLKTLQIGYNLSEKLIGKQHVENIRLYVSGFNLLTFDDVFPFDPEAESGRGLYYPQQKSISVGINITL